MFGFQLIKHHRFALIDPTRSDAIPPSIKTLSLAPSFVAEESHHLMPTLLPISTLTANQRGDLLDMMESADISSEWPPLCAFLETGAEADQIAAHLKRIQVLERHHGVHVHRTWLRVHDPRVFAQLARILPAEEQPVLFGPILRWTIPFGGEWIRLDRPASPDLSRIGNWRWPTARIAEIGIIARTLDRIGVRPYRDAIAISSSIEAELVRARDKYSLTHPEDLAEFAFTALTVSKQFDQHPAIQPHIPDPQDGSRLSDRFARLDKAVWQALTGQPEKEDKRSHQT